MSLLSYFYQNFTPFHKPLHRYSLFSPYQQMRFLGWSITSHIPECGSSMSRTTSPIHSQLLNPKCQWSPMTHEDATGGPNPSSPPPNLLAVPSIQSEPSQETMRLIHLQFFWWNPIVVKESAAANTDGEFMRKGTIVNMRDRL